MPFIILKHYIYGLSYKLYYFISIVLQFDDYFPQKVFFFIIVAWILKDMIVPTFT